VSLVSVAGDTGEGGLLAVKAYSKACLHPRHWLNLRREMAVLWHLRQCK